jgi:hypothetical protein
MRYSIGFQTAAAGASAAYAAFRAPTNTSRLFEIGLACNAATTSPVTLYRNTNGSYAASTSTSVGQAETLGSAAGTSLVDTAWSAAPTVTTGSKMRKFGLVNSAGAGFVWVFVNGLFVRAGTAADILVLWNDSGSTGSVLNGWAVWEE